MTYLTGAGILDDAMSMIQDNTTGLRTKMLRWLNVAAQQLVTIRTWQFLHSSVSATPVNNAITKPTDYGEFEYLQIPSFSTFDKRNRLTQGEADQADMTGMGYSSPIGYTENNTSIILHGASWSSAVTLGYIIEPPVIADSAASTIWPSKCKAYFMRYLMTAFYEYDFDERAAINIDKFQYELKTLKGWDNNQRPKTQYSRHGYRRTR